MKKFKVSAVLTLALALLVVPAVNAETSETKDSETVIMSTGPNW